MLSIEEFTRPSWGKITNPVTIQYCDGQTDKNASITVQDIAAIQLQGGVVAMHERRQLSSTLAKATLVANRQASSLDNRPGGGRR
ncbi:MAG: hypothetical protein AB1790_06445 [Pseudomonadota bacterium]